MPQEVRFRRQRQVNWDANNEVSEDLSRGMVYRELALRLKGQLTLTSGDNTSANTERGDEWALIKAIKIVANHTDVIKRIRGADLWWLNYFWFGKIPETSAEIADSNTANPSFNSVLILPFWMPRSAKPIDTALDGRELSGLEIVVEWGAATDVNSNVSGFETDPTLYVTSLESFNVSGPFSQWRLYPIEQEIVADNPELQIQLPVSYMYRGFTLIATDGGVIQGDIINNVKLRSGSTIYEDQQADVLNEWFPLRNGCESGPARRSDDDSINGVYRVDHVTDGYMTEAIDTLGFSEFTLELDVSVGSGTTKAIIYPDQLVPVRGQE
jgi:hypothetical protein